MKVKYYMLIAAATVIGLMAFQMGVAGNNVSAAEQPSMHFKITLLAPTNNPARVQHAQVIKAEMWKIGIDCDLVLVGWDVHIPRMFEVPGYKTYDAGGIDAAFIGWVPGDPLSPSVAWYYHSDYLKNGTGSTGNYGGLDDKVISDMIDEADKTLIFNDRQEILVDIVDRALWEIHSQEGLYHETGVYPYRNYVVGYEASKWSSSQANIAEMSVTSTEKTFTYASQAKWIDLNPSISNSLYDSYVHSMTFSSTYEYDVNWILHPVMASGAPVPLNSTSLITDYITLAEISSDSPFDGANATTTWGDNPAIDSEFDATVWEANRSMFLIPLREDVPWQPATAYGYSASDSFNVTADDYIWGMEYRMHEDHPGPSKAGLTRLFGSAELGFQKINDHLLKVNFRGGTGEGLEADWYASLAITAYPEHVLNPDFDAMAWGGGEGTYPGGKGSIPAIKDQKIDHIFNTGGEYCIVGNGPYRYHDWSDTQATATLHKFGEWGNGLWNETTYENNNIDTYCYTVIEGRDTALITFENGGVDALDGGNYRFGKDLTYLEGLSGQGVLIQLYDEAALQTMGYNLYHPKLKNRFVRLAISHILPRQRIVDNILGGLGTVNEFVGFAQISPYWPTEEQWKNDIGLDPSYDQVLPEGKHFQGHIRCDLDKAWALMELAGYDMTAQRNHVLGLEPNNKQFLPSLSELILVGGISLIALGLGAIIANHLQ